MPGNSLERELANTVCQLSLCPWSGNIAFNEAWKYYDEASIVRDLPQSFQNTDFRESVTMKPDPQLLGASWCFTSEADVLVGAHGAGLAWMVAMNPGASPGM